MYQRFKGWAEELGLKLTEEQLSRFKAYHKLLLDYNRRINLISRRDVDRIVPYHLVDSLVAIPFIPENASVCDLGSGGGLPGIPIKIVREDIDLSLVESIQKKANFLRVVIQELKLPRTQVLAQRAEAVRLEFDIVLARLLGRLKEILRLIVPLLRDGGKGIIYKSSRVEEELRTAEPIFERLRARVDDVKAIPLPSLPIQRRLVIIAKT